MMKLIGAILVLSSCTMMGYGILLKKKDTDRAIWELKDAISELSRAVGFQLETLPGAIRRLAYELSPEKNSFLSRLSCELEQDPTIAFSLAWKEALQSFSREKHLPQKAYLLLENLGESLGKADYKSEKEKLEQTAQSLGEILSQTQAETQKQGQMVKSLGVLLGAFLVILLL